MFTLVHVGLSALLSLAEAAQPSAPSPPRISAPLRPLPWGQLNFLHTTDTHGWHAGHLQEASYSADWGDYISFAQHLRDRADADGGDLLVVDTGDRIEGNGLYDASVPRGKYTFDIFTKQHIDIIVSGNHELYIANSSQNEFDVTVPAYKDSYIASNLDIYIDGKRQALASRYRKFTTKNQGIRVVAFGFLFDFHGNANNTVVIPVEKTVKQQWFQDAIRDREVDLFIVAGHVPVRTSDSPEYDVIYRAIRSVHYDTPIQMFGGHTHIRDYAVYDKSSVGLESGRYMETIGFQSISGLSTSKAASTASSLSFERLYIDNNLHSLHTHSGQNATTFETSLGKEASKQIAAAREELHLDQAYGCAPRDYWLNRAPYPANDSLLTWLDQEVLPWMVRNISSNSAKSDGPKPTIILTNSGAMRFDIFSGPFTIDSTYLVSPFTSGLRELAAVPYEKANKLLRLLNNQGPILLRDMLETASESELEDASTTAMLKQLMPPMPPVLMTLPEIAVLQGSGSRGLDQMPLGDRVRPSQSLRRSSFWWDAATDPADYLQAVNGDVMTAEDDDELTPGYTTHDDASATSPGDDTPHARIKFYRVPNVIGSEVGIDKASPPDTVDIVYNEFIERWIVLALRYLGEHVEGRGELLGGGRSLTEYISLWVAEHWSYDT